MDQKLVALLAFANGLFIAYVCICRLNATHINVIASVRFKYVMLLMGALAYGSQPILFNEWPTTGGLILQFSVSIGLASGFYRWREGPPADTIKPEIQPQGNAKSLLS